MNLSKTVDQEKRSVPFENISKSLYEHCNVKRKKLQGCISG